MTFPPLAPAILVASLIGSSLVPAIHPGETAVDSSSTPTAVLPLTTSDGEPTDVATAGLDTATVGSGGAALKAMRRGVLSAQGGDQDALDPVDGAAILTQPLAVSPFIVSGLTWDGNDTLTGSEFFIRVREGDEWSEWYRTEAEIGGARDDGVGKSGTEPFVSGTANAIQVRVTGEPEDLPSNLELTMIPDTPEGEVTLEESDLDIVAAEPTSLNADSLQDDQTPVGSTTAPTALPSQEADPQSGGTPSPSPLESTVQGPQAPGTGAGTGGGGSGTTGLLGRVFPSATQANSLPVPVSTRADWGADESLSTWGDDPANAPFVIVHHTAGTNSYTMAEAPGIVRGIYRYHAVSRGWGDIGYNFLVDKWGRAYEGRYGTIGSLPGQMTIGAHALGFNTGSMGISMLGDFTSIAPTAAALDTVGKLAAWQLKRAGVDPAGSGTFVNLGSNSKYSAGSRVPLARISGHRDVDATACPGNVGYTYLNQIRANAAATSVVTGSSPLGNFEGIDAIQSEQALHVKGWAVDRDVEAPITVRVYVNSNPQEFTADVPRPDVNRYLSLGRDEAGFNIKIPATPGTHSVCVWALNEGGGVSTLLGCKSATLAPLFTPGSDPLGNFETLRADRQASTITVGGWAVDTDVSTPIKVKIEMGTMTRTITADKSRKDVQNHLGLASDQAGFATTMPAVPGTHTVCVSAINEGGGRDLQLGCKTVELPIPLTVNAWPRGNFETVTTSRVDSTISANGWAIDTDVATPIKVRIYIDSSPRDVLANDIRRDVNNALRLGRDESGFSQTFKVAPGTHSVCVWALNEGGGNSTLLGCRSATVEPLTTTNTNPVGNFESAVANHSNQTISVSGWAVDTDVLTPIKVRVYIGSTPKDISANVPRADVQRHLDLTRSEAGFSTTLSAPPGANSVCVWALNEGGGNSQLLGCSNVYVGSNQTSFIAGNIIDDQRFFARNTMSTSQVQSFLNERNPSCTPGPDGAPCLKTARFNTTTSTQPYCSSYTGATGESSAQVLTKAANACGVNVQVLIVMLEKEQGLVSATGARLTQGAYTKAMGLACPDSGVCDPAKAGFATQVYGAASRLVQYGEEPQKYNFRANQTTAIRYHPNTLCGSSTVRIENRATAALYNYTPYQPNAAALANMNGVGDSCSAYGNRNFWRLMNSWF